MGLKSNDECSNKRQKRRRPRDPKGKAISRCRDSSDVSTSLRMPRVTNSYQKEEERYGMHFLSESSEETNPANTLVLKFWPLELQENKFLLF